MNVTNHTLLFGGLLGGKPTVGGVAVAEGETTSVVTTELTNAKATTLNPGPFATESIPARGPGRLWNANEQAFAQSPGQCHICGNQQSRNQEWSLGVGSSTSLCIKF